MAPFDNGDPEEFLLLIRNFNMNIAASGTLETAAKVQYLHTLLRGEALRKFDLMSADVESTNPLTVEAIILGLGTCFFTVNLLSNQKRAMRRGMRKTCGLKVRRYADSLI